MGKAEYTVIRVENRCPSCCEAQVGWLADGCVTRRPSGYECFKAEIVGADFSGHDSKPPLTSRRMDATRQKYDRLFRSPRTFMSHTLTRQPQPIRCENTEQVRGGVGTNPCSCVLQASLAGGQSGETRREIKKTIVLLIQSLRM